jgi:hypothetical protein
MARWRRLCGGLAVGSALAFAAGGLASAGEDGGGVDELLIDDLTEPVPDDAEALTDAETQAIIDELIVLAGLLPVESGDGSSSLTGPCGGFAYSYDGDGKLIDLAFDLGDGSPPQDGIDGGQAFTSGNPFVVDTDGKVTYLGFTTGGAPMDHTYALDVGGVQVASGGDPNTNENNRNAGTIFMDDELPFPITAKFSASGSMQSSLPECVGDGHVEINGNGLLDPAGLLGMGLTLIGLLGLLFNAPPARTWKG